jgi:hypothetical protein
MICEIVQQESASFLSLREEFRPLLALPQSVLDAILTWVLSRETFRAYGDEAAFALSSSNSERRGALGRLFLFWLTMNATSYFATNNWINALLFLFGLGALLLQFYPVALSLEPEKANLRRAIGQARGWVLRTFLSMLIALVPVFIPVALYMLWPTGDLPESAWIELLITPALFSFILFLANMTSIVAFLHARRAWKNS